MQKVPRPPSRSCTTYERIQRMSSDISSSPTCFERAAAACSSSGVRQPLGRRMTYKFIAPPSRLLGMERDRGADQHVAGVHLVGVRACGVVRVDGQENACALGG